MRGPETRLRKKIVEEIKKEYPQAIVWKFHGGPYQITGIPDLYILHRGISFWLEIKRPGGKATPLQIERIKEVNSAGGFAAVVTSIGEALDFILSH